MTVDCEADVKPETCIKPTRAASFDHLVGDGEYTRRNCQTERLGGLHVDDQLEFGRLLHREITRVFPLQNPADIHAGLTKGFDGGGRVAYQAAGFGELTSKI